MDYQGNADKSKEPPKKIPEKKIVKVVTGEVVQRPKPVVKRMRDVFFGGDFKVAVGYVAADVLLPALRNAAFDMVTEGWKRMLFGDSGFRHRPTEMRPRIQYNNPTYPRAPMLRDPRERIHLPDQSARLYRTGRRDVADIILSTKVEAELVVERLIDILDKYEVVSLADLYDLLGLPNSPIDNKWGWTVLKQVEIRQTREGYLIELPPLEEI